MITLKNEKADAVIDNANIKKTIGKESMDTEKAVGKENTDEEKTVNKENTNTENVVDEKNLDSNMENLSGFVEEKKKLVQKNSKHISCANLIFIVYAVFAVFFALEDIIIVKGSAYGEKLQESWSIFEITNFVSTGSVSEENDITVISSIIIILIIAQFVFWRKKKRVLTFLVAFVNAIIIIGVALVLKECIYEMLNLGSGLVNAFLDFFIEGLGRVKVQVKFTLAAKIAMFASVINVANVIAPKLVEKLMLIILNLLIRGYHWAVASLKK